MTDTAQQIREWAEDVLGWTDGRPGAALSNPHFRAGRMTEEDRRQYMTRLDALLDPPPWHKWPEEEPPERYKRYFVTIYIDDEEPRGPHVAVMLYDRDGEWVLENKAMICYTQCVVGWQEIVLPEPAPFPPDASTN